jgi:hypothetical protein
MERAGFVVLAWFAIGCLVALVIGQIIRKGSRAYNRHSIIAKHHTGPERPAVVKRGEHGSAERASQR